MPTTFRPYQPDQLLLLSPDVREWLPSGHLAHHVSDPVDALDLSAFYAPYEGDGRRNAPYEPSMMVKVLIYAYATGVFSSRAIARKLECQRLRRTAHNLANSGARYRRSTFPVTIQKRWVGLWPEVGLSLAGPDVIALERVAVVVLEQVCEVVKEGEYLGRGLVGEVERDGDERRGLVVRGRVPRDARNWVLRREAGLGALGSLLLGLTESIALAIELDNLSTFGRQQSRHSERWMRRHIHVRFGHRWGDRRGGSDARPGSPASRAA